MSVTLSARNTLIVNAPAVCAQVLETNDIAEINAQGQFRIIGRTDNTINSGGVKIQIEEVEAVLSQYIDSKFIITSRSDVKFGETIVLLTENPNIEQIKAICSEKLPKYWIPKHYIVCNIPYTQTNKPDRKRAKEIAEKG